MVNSGYIEDAKAIEKNWKEGKNADVLTAFRDAIREARDEKFTTPHTVNEELYKAVKPFAEELGIDLTGAREGVSNSDIVNDHLNDWPRGNRRAPIPAYLAWFAYNFSDKAKAFYDGRLNIKFRKYIGPAPLPKEETIQFTKFGRREEIAFPPKKLAGIFSTSLHDAAASLGWRQKITSLSKQVSTLVALAIISIIGIGAIISRQGAEEKLECLGDIARYIANSQVAPSEKLQINLNQDCKADILNELATSDYFNGLDQETRHRIITNLIEIAQKDLDFNSQDMGVLYLFRGLYGQFYNLTFAMEDIKTAYSLNPNLPVAYIFLAGIEQQSVDTDSFLEAKEKNFYRLNHDLFPWQKAAVHFLKYYNTINDENPQLATLDDIRSAFNEIDNDKSFFGLWLKMYMASFIAEGGNNNGLITRFIDVHGGCESLVHQQNTADCYKMLFIQHVNDKDYSKAFSYYDMALAEYQKIRAYNSEVSLFMLRRNMVSEPSIIFTKEGEFSAHDLQNEFLRLIKQARSNGDTLSQAILLYDYAYNVVGFLLNDHKKALSLVTEAIELYKNFRSPEFIKEKIYENTWREFQFGDKALAISQTQEKYDNATSEIDRFYAMYDLSHYYEKIGEKDKFEKLTKEYVAIFLHAIEAMTDLNELSKLSRDLIKKDLFNFAIGSIVRMEKLFLNSSQSIQDEYTFATSAYIAMRAYYQAVENQHIQLTVELKNTLPSLQFLLENIVKKDENGAYIFKNFKSFEYYLREYQQYSSSQEEKTLQKIESQNLTKKEIFEQKYLKNPEDNELGILESVKRYYSNEINSPVFIWNPRNDAIQYLREYHQPYEQWYIHDKDSDDVQIMLVSELLPDHQETLKAAFLAGTFGYRKEQPFSLDVDVLVLLAVTARLIGNNEDAAMFIKDAIDIIEGRAGQYRQSASEKSSDAQAIVMYAADLVGQCNYIEALEAFDRHKAVFKAMPELLQLFKKSILSINEIKCQ